jgi:MarR family 2-MHQ and catechol resistance regulon transcriptional repressor
MPTRRQSENGRASRRGTSRGVAPAEPALKLWVILSRAHAAIQTHAAADAARHDLTLAEFGILEALYHRGDMLIGELQRRVLVSSGGTTFLVDRLARRGLVERRECPSDRRARYATLTAKGERLIRAIFPAHAAAIQRAVSGLTIAEQRSATDLLRKLGLAAAALAPDDVGAGVNGRRYGAARRASSERKSKTR